MPIRHWAGSAGIVFHVLNRGARRGTLFTSDPDFLAFERVLLEAGQCRPMRLLSYAAMSNHWHLVLWPEADYDVPRYVQWLTRTHAQRWHLAHQSVGQGALYQGRFKAIPVQGDTHFLTVCRYVEGNPLRAGLVQDAAEWRWSSAWDGPPDPNRPAMHGWPVPRPDRWIEHVNQSSADRDVTTVRRCVKSGEPFGETTWAKATGVRLGWIAGLHRRGRPQRGAPGGNN